MAITGIITNEGLANSIKVANKEGFFIKPVKFAVSDTKGKLDSSRTINDINPTWFGFENISGVDIISYDTVQFRCTIPYKATTEVKDVAEIYLVGTNPEGQDFLLAIHQADPVIQYDPAGTLTLLIQIKIQNIDATDLFEFVYTAVPDIEDHNSAPCAHTHLLNALKKAGIFVDLCNGSEFTYVGQYWDEKAVFDSSVNDGMLVYRGSDGKYYPAIADGSEKEKVIGVAFPSRNSLVVSGLVEIPNATFNPNQMVYLSDTEAGSFTQNKTSVRVGYALTDKVVLLFAYSGLGADYVLSDLSNVSSSSIQNSNFALEILRAVVLGDYKGTYYKEISYNADNLPETIQVWKDSSKSEELGTVSITYNEDGLPTTVTYQFSGNTITENISYNEDNLPITVNQTLS